MDKVVGRGVRFFDTAEGYGGGASERRLACTLARVGAPADVAIATKFLPTLWRWTTASFLRAVKGSNRRLNTTCCPLFFIHTPVHPLPLEFWVRAACEAKRQGLIQAIGISNCDASQVLRAHKAASSEGEIIVANQIMFNLLSYDSPVLRETERLCHKLGITIIVRLPK